MFTMRKSHPKGSKGFRETYRTALHAANDGLNVSIDVNRLVNFFVKFLRFIFFCDYIIERITFSCNVEETETGSRFLILAFKTGRNCLR